MAAILLSLESGGPVITIQWCTSEKRTPAGRLFSAKVLNIDVKRKNVPARCTPASRIPSWWKYSWFLLRHAWASAGFSTCVFLRKRLRKPAVPNPKLLLQFQISAQHEHESYQYLYACKQGGKCATCVSCASGGLDKIGHITRVYMQRVLKEMRNYTIWSWKQAKSNRP